jgi:Ca2+-binding RTX toxin-like protein
MAFTMSGGGAICIVLAREGTDDRKGMSVSLISRKGGRRGAKLAAVFAGTLLSYLVVTAVPAMAASTCDNVALAARLDVMVGTDDDVALRDWGGTYEFSVNGGPFAACGGVPTAGNVVWINVTGSDAGNEVFYLLEPGAVFEGLNGESMTVDLGNGTDAFHFAWGDAPGQLGSDPFPGVGAYTALGTAADGTQVGSANCYGCGGAGSALVRLDDAEHIVVDGDNGAAADELDAAAWWLAATDVLPGTADDIPASDSPFRQDVTFNAGNGDDWFQSGDGNDTYLGGPGDDDVVYWEASQGVVVDLAAGTATGMGTDALSDVQNVWGSDWDDTITGSGLNNELRAGPGDDVVSGGGGNDFVVGGPDDDVVAGGAGNDDVYGGPGDDVLVEDAAANGADYLNGGTVAFGPDGYDVLDYSARTNPLYVEHNGGPNSGEGGCPTAVTCEDDEIAPTFSEFWLGSGADEFVGAGVDEWVVPGLGDDIVDGNGDSCPGVGCGDTLDLSASATSAVFDLINGTATSDQGTETIEDIESAVGTDADDTMIIDENSPFVDFWGGDGVDTVDGSQAMDDLFIYLWDLGNGKEVENAIGGAGDDTIEGNEMANMLWGGDGNDWIDGLFGNDWIDGGAGNDAMTGGAGADTLSFQASPNGVVVDNQLGFAAGYGDDAIDFFEIIFGSAYDDEIIAGQTQFSANQRIVAGTGDDIIVGSNSSDLLKGGGGNDNIRGGQGDDDLMGAGGDDYLSGSQGDDYLKGGKGTDTGNGGKGDDVCKGVEFPKSC